MSVDYKIVFDTNNCRFYIKVQNFGGFFWKYVHQKTRLDVFTTETKRVSFETYNQANNWIKEIGINYVQECT